MTTHTEQDESAVQEEEVVTTPSFRDINVEIHARWVQAHQEHEAAKAAGDEALVKKTSERINAIGDEFITVNRGLATSEANRFFASSDRSSQDDYVAAALFGLWEAFVKWDPSKKVTFGTFSRQYIKGRTQRTVRASEYSQISQTDFNRRREVRNSLQRLTAQLGRTPSYAEIAQDTKLSVGLVERALKPKTAYLDTPVGDGERTLGDLLDEPLAQVDLTEEQSAALERLFGNLNETELWVMVQRYGLAGGPPQSLVEVADTIGIGREIARRSEKSALSKLNHAAQGR